MRILESRPCSQAWDAMLGTPGERHCEACDKQVHNFAAMTAAEIERLVREKQGSLCARIVHRADGSLVSLDGQSQPSVAAGVVLAASLAFGATATAQSAPEHSQAAKAQLSGTVLVPDGSEPAAGAKISLIANFETVAETTADAHGNFQISAEPGRYDIDIRQNALFGKMVAGANLHAGEQSLQPIRTQFGVRGGSSGDFVTMGVMVSTYKYPISYLFKHPLRYLKHLPHNF
ncbi:MAG: carboxypeptidase regulatory-like domain-containing protein [Terracidiphilus sp.]